MQAPAVVRRNERVSTTFLLVGCETSAIVRLDPAAV
jgi:hypothetical protein